MLFGFSLGVAVYQSSLAQDDVQTTPDLSQRHSSPELEITGVLFSERASAQPALDDESFNDLRHSNEDDSDAELIALLE
jgi:hypothetical protein